MMRNSFVAVLLTCGASIGCQDATAPRGSLTVTATPLTVVATRSPAASVTWGRFVVQVTLRNATESTMRVYGCGPAVEREVTTGRWEIALEPFCALVGPGYFELPPGSDRSRQAEIVGALSGPGGPEFLDGVLAGRYRLMYRYSVGDYAGEADKARSAPFDVTE
jgi:hypothetical protein